MQLFYKSQYLECFGLWTFRQQSIYNIGHNPDNIIFSLIPTRVSRNSCHSVEVLGWKLQLSSGLKLQTNQPVSLGSPLFQTGAQQGEIRHTKKTTENKGGPNDMGWYKYFATTNWIFFDWQMLHVWVVEHKNLSPFGRPRNIVFSDPPPSGS